MKYTFKKEEKLKSRKLIDKLFQNGKRLKSFPIQLVYLQTDHTSDYLVQAGFSVSKKYFKRAVDRNKVKRLMREAYRLQKNLLLDSEEKDTKKMIFMFIYIGKEIFLYEIIQKNMLYLLQEIKQKIN